MNAVGADYRILLGLKDREDTALAVYNGSLTPPWAPVYDTSGFVYLNQVAGEKFFELGLKWSDIGSPDTVRLVSINIFFNDTINFTEDWVPDVGNGFITLIRQNRYVGQPGPPAPGLSPVNVPYIRRASSVPNPFDR